MYGTLNCGKVDQSDADGGSLGSGYVPPEVRYARAAERIADSLERIERKIDETKTKAADQGGTEQAIAPIDRSQG